VLLRRRGDARISPRVAPGQSTIGVMLPYSPLHELLFARAPGERSAPRFTALVMTSGNVSEEPIASANAEALHRLAPLADAFLLHDRDIAAPCDDSVVRVFDGRELPIRRSRGYAPMPVRLPISAPPLVAAGAELKSTFCVARRRYAFLSQHVGDLGNYETLTSFESCVTAFERLFRIRPEIVAHDLHPDHLATRWALHRAARDGLRAVGVQHHHAHVAACIVENGIEADRAVIGVAFDGAGHGSDGAVWGGEFLVADLRGFERAAHLAYVPLPGGDAATRRPWRIALSWLRRAGVDWSRDLAPVAAAGDAGCAAVAAQIRTGANAPPTSSMGRLFDAAASIAGVRQEVTYEGQAAMEFEAMADSGERGAYPIPGEVTGALDLAPLVRALAADVRSGAGAGVVSARFHVSVAMLVRDVCAGIRRERGTVDVVLTGGVFQNVLLLRRTLDLLRAAGFRVHVHHEVPPNDGGLALGQAAIAARLAQDGG
jgi:hydrogenase maturation protein HypF